MVFNSLAFLLFFAVVLILYWKIPKRTQWLLLLIASYYFYMSWKPAYAVLILFTTIVSFYAALLMEKQPKQKRLFLLLATALNLAVLFVFKYYNFFSLSLTPAFEVLGLTLTLPQFELLLPVGISFYTFQTISYVADVYRQKISAEKHFGFFALYVSFFPQLVAGPIERTKNLLPQLKKTHHFQYQQVVSGLQLFTFGLVKKVVIADNLALVVDAVFTDLQDFKGLSLVIAILFFAIQIFCDFSGYTDMARGVARILGFDLIKNFDRPYLATSISDFWRRWHMSLTSWFRDYVYIPLGGNRKGLLRTCLNSIIVFILCGLWHGAAWTFVLWGAFHGVLLAAERVYTQFKPQKFTLPVALSTLITFATVCAGWVLFRAPTLTDAIYVYTNSVSGLRHFIQPRYIWATIQQLYDTNMVEFAISVYAITLFIVTCILFSRNRVASLILHQPKIIRWSLYILAVSSVVLLRQAEVQEFIYFQF